MSSVRHTPPLSSPTSPSNAVDGLPPLPEIRSEQIRKRIFTHSSSLAKGQKHAFQAPEDDLPVDNEEFGHIGDQVFALAVTDLIQQLYPHLRVGPASKVRDHIKCKDMLAKISLPYGLHTKLNLPERQGSDHRASQSVQVDVFKAYVGGVYRDQGVEVVSEWLISLLQPHVEDAYRKVREDHLLPPESDPSLSSSTSSEGPGAALPSYLAGGPSDLRRLTALQANVPQRGSAQAGDSVGTRRAVHRGRRRRRRSSTSDGGSGYADATSSQRHSSTGLGSADSARKRLRAEGANDG